MKNFIIFMALFFTFESRSSDLSLEKSTQNQKYYLIGNCNEARNEISQINTNFSPECKCEHNICKTELTSALPTRINVALNYTAKEFGPNCWNSVLYVKGVHESFSMSEEMDFYLASPFCEEVEGKQLPGDIITQYDTRFAFNDLPTFVFNVHSFISLSDTFAFNKNGPEIDYPYEIIRKDDWMIDFKIKKECQFSGIKKGLESKCDSILVAYRCSKLESIKEKWMAYKRQLPHSLQDDAIKDLTPYMKNNLAQELAERKLKIPDFAITPKSIKNKMFGHKKEDYLFVFFMASPDMKIPHSLAFSDAIKEARRLKFYSKLPYDERLMWMNVYFRGFDL
jgi:hypothetical protein